MTRGSDSPPSTAAAGPVRLRTHRAACLKYGRTVETSDQTLEQTSDQTSDYVIVGLETFDRGKVASWTCSVIRTQNPPATGTKPVDRTQPPPDWWIHLVEVELGPLAEHEIEALWDLALM